jgi:HSP20 family protein
MPEVNAVKQPKQEGVELSRWLGFDAPLFSGSLFRVDPFALMRHFTADMDRIFGEIPNMRTDRAVWTPTIEVKEKGCKLFVTADLPGLKKEDVKVRIDGQTLVVEGERKQEFDEKRDAYYHSERSYGKFYRSITVPEGAKTDETAAQFNNGVLEITMPLPEVKAKRQEVPIQEASKTKAA